MVTATVTRVNPYLPTNPYISATDPNSNTSHFFISDSTLREGEHGTKSSISTGTKLKIAKTLDRLGVDIIEIASPSSSAKARDDCEAICQLGLKTKIFTQVPLDISAVEEAIELGVDGIEIVMGVTDFFNTTSTEEDIDATISLATDLVSSIRARGILVKFSIEDTFQADIVALLRIYASINKVGVNQVGVTDTFGYATPRQVYELVRTMRSVLQCSITCRFYNDSGCAVANAYCALEAGANCINTSVLGLGERSGVTPLGGLMKRMMIADQGYVSRKYKLESLKGAEEMVAKAAGVDIPFNNFIPSLPSQLPAA